jgi:uncharacterized coiled-coil protein SlyX
MHVTKELEAQLEAETPEKAKQLEPVLQSGPSRRKTILHLSLFALLLNGAAAVYTLPSLPSFDMALPNFANLAELLPHEKATAPIPDPIVTSALRDIQSAQQQHLAALQESESSLQQNTILLLRGTATLDSLKQGLSTQQTDVKRLSAQLSTLAAKVDALQNAMTPETTSSISQMRGRARASGMARKRISRLPKPAGPVSVGGAPLSFIPASVTSAAQSPEG